MGAHEGIGSKHCRKLALEPLPKPVQGSAHNGMAGYSGDLPPRTGTCVLLFPDAAPA